MYERGMENAHQKQLPNDQLQFQRLGPKPGDPNFHHLEELRAHESVVGVQVGGLALLVLLEIGGDTVTGQGRKAVSGWVAAGGSSRWSRKEGRWVAA